MPMAITAEDAAELGKYSKDDPKKRGYTIYNFSQLQAMTGLNKKGEQQTVTIERPYFELSPEERLDIFRKCDMVFGVVSSRCNRISSTKWNIVPDKKAEDKIIFDVKSFRDLYVEYNKRLELKYRVVAATMAREVCRILPECLPDLSNFEQALLRWKKRLEFEKADKEKEIEDWLHKPNIIDSWEDFAFKWVFDLLVHGGVSTYKLSSQGKLAQFHVLPGGTVLPVRSKFVGDSVNCFVQITANLQVQVLFGDEVTWTNYIPTSARAYGFIPIEALINKVAESLLFDEQMAMQADGTKPPEKVVIFGDKSPFGDIDEAETVPMDADRQKRVETLINERRQYAIRTLTGIGTPTVLDLSKENTMATQSERQQMMRESVALVFNASNMEVNLTGSESTSGRATSEEQGLVDYSRGVWPIMAALQRTINDSILPFRYGAGYKFEFESGMNETSELQMQAAMLQAGFSVNEIREERGQARIIDPTYDLPFVGGALRSPGSDELNPLIMRQIK